MPADPTPGPWRYDGVTHVIGDDRGDRRVVATLNGPHACRDSECERCANGRLLAAAPELLEVAGALYDRLNEKVVGKALYTRLQEVLGKAFGTTIQTLPGGGGGGGGEHGDA
jgi:hypothetical protein